MLPIFECYSTRFDKLIYVFDSNTIDAKTRWCIFYAFYGISKFCFI